MAGSRDYITQDYVYAPRRATIQDVLVAYVARQGQWWWLLVSGADGEHEVCSFGSLLPYLTGRTSHIVHTIGACVVCSGLDPIVWRDTRALIVEALGDERVRTRAVCGLPMAKLPVIDVERVDEPGLFAWVLSQGARAYGVLEDGVFAGVCVDQFRTMGDLGGVPNF